MGRISAVITTIAGEEKYLGSCLASIKNLCDEIVVTDMSGGSEISKIAKKYDAKVFKHDFVNYVEPVRNFGIEKAGGDWILILDPDEEISQTLANQLKQICGDEKADFVRVPRKNIIFGKWIKHSRWWPDHNVRFFKKDMVSWTQTIHGVPITQGDGLDLEPKEELAIVHHHYDSIEQYIERMNRYTSIQAKSMFERHVFKWQDIIAKPVAEFVGRYFAGEGYKDGLHGLGLASMQAFSELFVYLKVWQMQGFKDQQVGLKDVVDEIGNAQKEINYWKNDAQVMEGGGIIPRIKRKFRL